MITRSELLPASVTNPAGRPSGPAATGADARHQGQGNASDQQSRQPSTKSLEEVIFEELSAEVESPAIRARLSQAELIHAYRRLLGLERRVRGQLREVFIARVRTLKLGIIWSLDEVPFAQAPIEDRDAWHKVQRNKAQTAAEAQMQPAVAVAEQSFKPVPEKPPVVSARITRSRLQASEETTESTSIAQPSSAAESESSRHSSRKRKAISNTSQLPHKLRKSSDADNSQVEEQHNDKTEAPSSRAPRPRDVKTSLKTDPNHEELVGTSEESGNQEDRHTAGSSELSEPDDETSDQLEPNSGDEDDDPTPQADEISTYKGKTIRFQRNAGKVEYWVVEPANLSKGVKFDPKTCPKVTPRRAFAQKGSSPEWTIPGGRPSFRGSGRYYGPKNNQIDQNTFCNIEFHNIAQPQFVVLRRVKPPKDWDDKAAVKSWTRYNSQDVTRIMGPSGSKDKYHQEETDHLVAYIGNNGGAAQWAGTFPEHDPRFKALFDNYANADIEKNDPDRPSTAIWAKVKRLARQMLASGSDSSSDQVGKDKRLGTKPKKTKAPMKSGKPAMS